MVSPDEEGHDRAFQEVAPLLTGELKGQQLPVTDGVVSLCRGKMA